MAESGSGELGAGGLSEMWSMETAPSHLSPPHSRSNTPQRSQDTYLSVGVTELEAFSSTLRRS